MSKDLTEQTFTIKLELFEENKPMNKPLQLEVSQLADARGEGDFLVLVHQNGDKEFIRSVRVKQALLYLDVDESEDDASA